MREVGESAGGRNEGAATGGGGYCVKFVHSGEVATPRPNPEKNREKIKINSAEND